MPIGTVLYHFLAIRYSYVHCFRLAFAGIIKHKKEQFTIDRHAKKMR